MKKVKNSIAKLFINRNGFTDDIINVIARCYVFLQDTFDDVISLNAIPDERSFLIKSDYKNGRSLANIFLNRIYNNVLTITNNTTATGQYFPLQKTIAISDLPVDMQQYKKLNFTSSQLQKIQQQLTEKVIAHELFHASCDNGIGIGFLLREDKLGEFNQSLIQKLYPNSSQRSAECSRLEEMITEMLALNSTQINQTIEINSKNKKVNFSVLCRNVNSTNAPLNPISEYFVRCFSGVYKAKFIDGFSWLAEFSKLHPYYKTTQNHFAYKLNNDFKFIANHYYSDVISYAQKALKLLIKHQEAMLKYYLDHIKVCSKQDVIKLAKDYVAFSIFAVKENQTIPQKIQLLLDNIKDNCILYANTYNLTLNDSLFSQNQSQIKCHSEKTY